MLPDIAARRLHAQRLTGERFGSAMDAVAWLGAVQAQDYAGAKWGLAQRVHDLTDSDLDRLFDEGVILRTHVMRPTWHFLLPADIRWMLELTGPRVKAKLATYDRQLEVDSTLVGRSNEVIEAALGDASSLTRIELGAALGHAGISAAGQRLGHLLFHAELDAIVVSGPRRGRQFTYSLLANRAPSAQRLDREEALAELTRRYFTSHGPAQVQDFAWWSGLTLADGKRGLGLVGGSLKHEVSGEKSYWSATDEPPLPRRATVVHLLPNYDEFLVAYRDRSASMDPARKFDITPFPRGSILANVVVLNGQVWGGWKRRLAGRKLTVELGPLDVLETSGRKALRRAADDLARFSGIAVTVTGLTQAEVTGR